MATLSRAIVEMMILLTALATTAPAFVVTSKNDATSVLLAAASSGLVVGVGTILTSLVNAVFGLLAWVTALVLFVLRMLWSVGEILGTRRMVNELVVFVLLGTTEQLGALSQGGFKKRQKIFECPAWGCRAGRGFSRYGCGVHL